MFVSPQLLNEMVQLGDDFQGVIAIGIFVDDFIDINLTYALLYTKLIEDFSGTIYAEQAE